MSRRATDLRAAVAEVVANGNCSGCGGCAGLSSGFEMALDDAGYQRPRWVGGSDGPTHAEALRRFAALCPGMAVPAVADTPRRHPVLGGYVAMWAGHATDPELRFRGSSGGVLSALSQWALARDPAAEIVAARRSERPPTRTRVTVLRSREDVLAAAGSRYAPVASAAALDHPVDVFVGKPCEAYAARELTRDASTTILSFFCAGTPSQHATDDLVRGLGADPDEVVGLRYRGHGCPGNFVVEDTSGERRAMSYDESWGQHLGRALQDRCKICVDGTGEHADVAVGDYWAVDERGFPSFDEGEGTSVVIARTERGARLVAAAEAAGVIELAPVDPDGVARVQPFQSTRRHALLGRLLGRRLAGRRVPRYRGHGLGRLGLRNPRETVRQARGTFGRSRGAGP